MPRPRRAIEYSDDSSTTPTERRNLRNWFRENSQPNWIRNRQPTQNRYFGGAQDIQHATSNGLLSPQAEAERRARILQIQRDSQPMNNNLIAGASPNAMPGMSPGVTSTALEAGLMSRFPGSQFSTYECNGPSVRTFVVPQLVGWNNGKATDYYQTPFLRWHFKRNIISDMCFLHSLVFWITFLCIIAAAGAKYKSGEANRKETYSKNCNAWGMAVVSMSFLALTVILEFTRPQIMRVLMVLRHEEEKKKWGRYWPFYSIGMTRIYPLLSFAMMASMFGCMVYLYLDEYKINEKAIAALKQYAPEDFDTISSATVSASSSSTTTVPSATASKTFDPWNLRIGVDQL
ncbi:hypothetical protein H072_6128 [Dactylellina haptotyla CBS 200.50]|uniref:Uncharacterized protein n=1 Tax=Dactylellina haptotyla (strain CBS 200.50) TaxID=1284197 RepID=S8BXJ7_DACHA|nr:hypothetical protein H072_6128 [Dactylellina haptotyla CBS 200.50]